MWTLIITFNIWTHYGFYFIPSVSTGYKTHAACDAAGHEAHLELLRRNKYDQGFEWKCVEMPRVGK